MGEARWCCQATQAVRGPLADDRDPCGSIVGSHGGNGFMNYAWCRTSSQRLSSVSAASVVGGLGELPDFSVACGGTSHRASLLLGATGPMHVSCSVHGGRRALPFWPEVFLR